MDFLRGVDHGTERRGSAGRFSELDHGMGWWKVNVT